MTRNTTKRSETFRDLLIRGVVSVDFSLAELLYGFYKKINKLPKNYRKKAKLFLLKIVAYKFSREIFNFVSLLRNNKINVRVEKLLQNGKCHIRLIILDDQNNEIEKATIYINRANRFLTDKDASYLSDAIKDCINIYLHGVENF